jgi:predicted GNAT family N-acyltransferase
VRTKADQGAEPPGSLQLVAVRKAAEMEDALSVRRAVFIQEQGVSETEEIDAHDGNPEGVTSAVHVVAYLAGRPVATGRLLLDAPPGKSAHIGRVAVLRDYRGQGLGKAVMLALQGEAQRRGYQGITLAAQLQAIPFYEGLGYTARGDVFLDADIEHRWMDLRFRHGQG